MIERYLSLKERDSRISTHLIYCPFVPSGLSKVLADSTRPLLAQHRIHEVWDEVIIPDYMDNLPKSETDLIDTSLVSYKTGIWMVLHTGPDRVTVKAQPGSGSGSIWQRPPGVYPNGSALPRRTDING